MVRKGFIKKWYLGGGGGDGFFYRGIIMRYVIEVGIVAVRVGGIMRLLEEGVVEIGGGRWWR